MTERTTPRRSPASAPLLVALLAAIPLLASAYVLLSDDDEVPGIDDVPRAAAREAAAAFLDRYVDEDGRVVRHDQGGDTVSEGQSYALLLAQVAEERETFGRVWDWTRSNLLRPDGLLASHSDGERVIDRNPASDGDLVTAWALVRASGPGADELRSAGRRMADVVREREIAAPPGPELLAAGTWATGPAREPQPELLVAARLRCTQRGDGRDALGGAGRGLGVGAPRAHRERQAAAARLGARRRGVGERLRLAERGPARGPVRARRPAGRGLARDELRAGGAPPRRRLVAAAVRRRGVACARAQHRRAGRERHAHPAVADRERGGRRRGRPAARARPQDRRGRAPRRRASDLLRRRLGGARQGAPPDRSARRLRRAGAVWCHSQPEGLALVLDPASVHTQTDNGSPVVVVTGEIDMATAPMLGRELTAAIESGDGPVVLDLSEVTFFDSSGLRVAIVAHRDLGEQDRRLAVVCSPEGHVRRTFALAGLADVLDLHPSREAALSDLTG